MVVVVVVVVVVVAAGRCRTHTHKRQSPSFRFRNILELQEFAKIVGRLLHHLFAPGSSPTYVGDAQRSDTCPRTADGRGLGVRRKAAVVSYPNRILARLIKFPHV